MKNVRAYHFLAENKKLGYGDGRTVEPGHTLSVEGDPGLCKYGLHASVRVMDALKYAPGPVLCEVEVGGDIAFGGDKLVGTTRKCIWMRDATKELRLFAVWCAREALKLIPNPDPRSIAACDVAERHANGEATDEELAAARDAAWDAAWAAQAAARDAAWAARAAQDAAQDAAWAAAQDAAQDAAQAAAWAAARDAAQAAAQAAAWAAAQAAAWDARAARDAAWDAAWDAQSKKLQEMLGVTDFPESF